MPRKRYVAAWLLAAAIGACSHSPTRPSAAIEPGTVVYDTLNPPESRTSTRLYESVSYIDTFGRPVDGGWAIDDFTPRQTAQVRTVRWQGGYCDPRFQVPLAIPTPIARSFRITFSEDRGGPSTHSLNAKSLLEITVAPADIAERKMFEVLQEREFGCGSKVPAPMAHYDYTLTLTAPLAVTAGTKYWFRVMADIGVPTVVWGWRGGTGGTDVPSTATPTPRI